MANYQSTKIFDNFSVALRQHKAQHSHCQLLHGYAFKIKVWFESKECETDKMLDEMNWIVDFGLFSRNGLKDWLNYMFDHTLLVEKDDPQLESFKVLEELGLCSLRIMDKMGAESLAKLIFDKFTDVFEKTEGGRIMVSKVEVFENDKNSGIYSW
jgi:6-pyruvoyltetrahydropterin/6-carboxytetrahydropterin synthase